MDQLSYLSDLVNHHSATIKKNNLSNQVMVIIYKSFTKHTSPTFPPLSIIIYNGPKKIFSHFSDLVDSFFSQKRLKLRGSEKKDYATVQGRHSQKERNFSNFDSRTEKTSSIEILESKKNRISMKQSPILGYIFYPTNGKRHGKLERKKARENGGGLKSNGKRAGKRAGQFDRACG